MSPSWREKLATRKGEGKPNREKPEEDHLLEKITGGDNLPPSERRKCPRTPLA